MSASLQHALEALYGLERRRDKHDLDGISALLRALGDPHRRFRSVHVAGTNGKGSVCALVERVLRECGIRTGLFTSPHLVDFRERIRVNGRWADEAWLERRLEHIERLPEGKDRTFFEVCTALAFDYFAEQQVEIAVVEVGLGGRLDCTNVLAPEVCVITTIGLDHTEILGDTLEKVAAEKAGIIKPGVPVVLGEMPSEARGVVEAVAAERGAPLARRRRGERWFVPELPEEELRRHPILRRDFVSLGTYGFARQPPRPFLSLNDLTAANALAALAGSVAPMREDAIVRGFVAARWPGRLEDCPSEPHLWWDGAHNASGMEQLIHAWQLPLMPPRPAMLVLALSSDKDADGVLRVLRAGFPEAQLVVTRTRNQRAMTSDVLSGRAAAAGFAVERKPDIPSAVRHGLARAGDGAVLLTGSLFAVGEAMEVLGGAPGEVL